MWVLPITNTDKVYPTHVAVSGRTKNNGTTGYVLCEKIKAIDPAARSAKLTDEAERELLEDCKKIIDAITYIGQ
ncbi:type II toxin-antitoxin system PemK/MazF family toxin [Salinicoccus roseus]|uniref:type II toxin-antitoxin system PemK/MazF family toxin n=1 Tax=Salinicoccus roseus TaxID=45670 RepID=UPI0009FC7D76